MSERHVALIVEDDPQIAEALEEILASIDHASRRASTLEEVRAAVLQGGLCYALLDMQIPPYAGARPLVSAGETALALLRKAHPRRNEQHQHLFPILVVTGYSKEPDFVARIYDAEGNGFIAKPFGDRIELVHDKIRASLLRAGHEEHAACLADRSRDVPAPPSANAKDVVMSPGVNASEVRLVLDGKQVGRRTGLLCRGQRRELQDARFLVLLRLALAHIRAPGSWLSRTELGIARSPEVPSRIAEVFADLVPEGFVLVESDRNGSHRLNAAVVVEVDWTALGRHSSEGVRKVVKKQGEGN